MGRGPARIGLALAFALSVGAACAKDVITDAGPFRIEMVEKRIGAGGFPNTSGNPFKTTSVTEFRVTHRGKRLVVPDGKVSHDAFWEAKVLDGPRPALLLAITGAYLVTEENGQPRIEVLASGGSHAHWQWLDGPDGQPSPEQAVGIRHAGDEPRAERGGRLLLVNRMKLLDVSTLATREVWVNSNENVPAAGGYNAGNSPAKALSPGRTQHVKVGDRRVNDAFEFALVVMDHATGRAYAVPFDRTAMRFESAEDVTPEWIARSFEWKRDASGAERLQARKDAKPAPWLGRFVRFGGGMVDYRLVPTSDAMAGVLHEFVVREFGAVPNPAPQLPEGSDSKAILVEGRALRIYREPRQRKTSVYAESVGGVKPAYDLVEKVGQRFNEELAKGKHQHLFTAYPD